MRPPSRHLPRVALIGFLLSATILPTVPAFASTEGKVSLYEVIGRDPYRDAWRRLTAPVVAANRWLKGARGVWYPARIVVVDADRYKVFFLCKVNECATNRIAVIFTQDGRHAFGAFRNPAGTQFLGLPNENTRHALMRTLNEERPRE